MKETTSGLSIFVQPTVSVLIAAYNADAFLLRAVRSALNQTRAPLEVLIINDASTDNTLAVANALAAEDPRVRVLTLPRNSGPAAARNAGLNAARGTWIAVLDADDAYIPSRLETLALAHAEQHTDVVLDNLLFFDFTCNAERWAAMQPTNAIEPIDIYDFVEHARPYANQADWGLLKPMFRREFLKTRGLRYPEHSRHGEDFLLMFRALHAGGRCLLVHTPGYLYSTFGTSRTTKDFGMMIKHTRNLLDEPNVRSDLWLSRLLRQRIIDLKKWSTELRLREIKEKKDYIRLTLMAMTIRSLAGRAATSAFRNIRRTIFGR